MSGPKSMTAFGRGEAGPPERRWVVELRSVNHRFRDIKLKMPRRLAPLEERVKKEIGAVFSRGHVDVMVTAAGGQAEWMEYTVDMSLARGYYRCLLELCRGLSLPETPGLAAVLEEKNIVVPVERRDDLDLLWPELRDAVRQAAAAADAMRRDEGASLKDELLGRLEGFEATVSRIEAAVPELTRKKETALKDRLGKLLEGVDIDPARLAQEVAILVDKADITEELVRLKSHIGQFRGFMEIDEPVGRRIDFLLQEFLREINTMASKINDAAITHLTVDLKNEVEKMREQAANLE